MSPSDPYVDLAVLLEARAEGPEGLKRLADALPPRRRLEAGAATREALVEAIENLGAAGAVGAAVRLWTLLAKAGWADRETALAAVKRIPELHALAPRPSLRRALRLLYAQAPAHGGILYRFAEAFQAVGDLRLALTAITRAGDLGARNVNTFETADRIATQLRAAPAERRILVIGNCQALSMAACLRRLCPTAEVYGELWSVHQEPAAVERLMSSVDGFDLVITQHFTTTTGYSSEAIKARAAKAVEAPRIFFTGFHPDLVRLLGKDTPAEANFRAWHSGIILAGYRMGLPRERVARLFNAYIYGRLGYFEEFERAVAQQTQVGAPLGLPLAELSRAWARQGAFAHMPDHPTIWVINELAKYICTDQGLTVAADAALPPDLQGEQLVWPVYPEIAKRLDIEGSLVFKPHRPLGVNMTLPEMIDSYYALYDRFGAPEHPRAQTVEVTLRAEGL